MRVAPIGLYVARSYFGFPEHDRAQFTAEAFAMGCAAAQLTHGHPTGILSAGMFAGIIFELAVGQSLRSAIDVCLELLSERPHHEETKAAVQAALALADLENKEGTQNVDKLGYGWVAEEALAIAIFCALAAKSFKSGVIRAVNHDGDSDSTGSMTGNLLGSIHGLDAIPHAWQDAVECGDLVDDIAQQLVAL
jgi:ADP-ribosylglycohydrolase